MITEFFTNQQLHLDVIGSICTDGAPAVLGNRLGFAALMRKEIPNQKVTRCLLRRHAPAARKLPLNLKKTLDGAVKVVNMIRERALNHRVFLSLCEEIGKEDHTTYYAFVSY